jgi:Barstar (barnase inhibitor)
MNEDLVLTEVETEFHPLLFEGDSGAIYSAVSGWSDARLTVRRVRGSKMRTSRGLFDEVAAALQFPDYFGENWDAFNECIAELDMLPAGEGYVIVITEPGQVLAETRRELALFAASLTSAAKTWGQAIDLGEWWDRPAVPFHVVLAGIGEDLNCAARRWSAAGAKPIFLRRADAES